MATFNGYLYAGQGDGGGDGDIQVCNPVGGGSATICDNAADWSASYSTAAYSQVLTMIVYKGRLYAGLGDGSGLGDVIVCNPATNPVVKMFAMPGIGLMQLSLQDQIELLS